jgi:hypothetical protein
MNNPSLVGIAFLLGFPLFFEGLLELAWVPFYYRTGIEIYNTSYVIPGVGDISVAFQHIAYKLKGNFFHTRVQIHRIGSHIYAFRYDPFEWDLSFKKGSIMHRVICFNPGTGEMKIIGYLNWRTVLVFILLALIPGWTWVQIKDWGQYFWMLFIACLLALVIIVIGYSIDSGTNKKVGESIVQYFKRI